MKKKLETIPEEALSTEHRGAITSPICQLCSAKSCKSTVLCSKLSVSPGHTADSCSCHSGPASLFLQRCHLASCSQNGNPTQCARLCHHTVLAGPFFQNAQVPLNGSPVLLAVPWLFLPTWCHMWTCWGDILPQHQGHWWRCWAEQLQHQALRYTAWHRLSAGHWYFKPEGPACFAQTVVHPCGP